MPFSSRNMAGPLESLMSASWETGTCVVPSITGTAWITGFASYVVDPTDPFPEGFTVGDLW